MSYKALIPNRVATQLSLCEVGKQSPKTLGLDAPALEIMTDLKIQKAISINGSRSISEAERLMAKHRVHLLFVLNDSSSMVGLVTSEDVLGEKVLKLLHKHKLKISSLAVEDIMTKKKLIEVLSYDDVRISRVGDILETLNREKRAHALVIDNHLSNSEVSYIRGIFSLNQIIKQTGEEAVRHDASVLDYLNQKYEISSLPLALNP